MGHNPPLKFKSYSWENGSPTTAPGTPRSLGRPMGHGLLERCPPIQSHVLRNVQALKGEIWESRTMPWRKKRKMQQGNAPGREPMTEMPQGIQVNGQFIQQEILAQDDHKAHAHHDKKLATSLGRDNLVYLLLRAEWLRTSSTRMLDNDVCTERFLSPSNNDGLAMILRHQGTI